MPKAVKANSTSTNLSPERFLENVLAPISENSEQAETPEARKLIQADMMRDWKKGMEEIKSIDDARSIEIRKDLHSAASLSLYRQYLGALNRQALIRSPTEVELRWKQKSLVLAKATAGSFRRHRIGRKAPRERSLPGEGAPPAGVGPASAYRAKYDCIIRNDRPPQRNCG